MISTQLVILLLVVAALAFFAGYQLGRQAQASPGSEPLDMPPRSGDARTPAGNPLNPLPGPRSIDSPRPRAAPPPASAGGSSGGAQQSEARPELKRTSAPPPARAGLLDPGEKK